jgi:hypothetical protein
MVEEGALDLGLRGLGGVERGWLALKSISEYYTTQRGETALTSRRGFFNTLPASRSRAEGLNVQEKTTGPR